MVLPTGTTVPPVPHLLALLALVAASAAAVVRTGPPVTARTPIAAAPWMATGAALYVCHQLSIVPDPVAPLTSSPAVYVSTAAVAALLWAGAAAADLNTDVALAASGGIALVAPVAAAVLAGLDEGTLTLAWPAAAVGIGIVAAAATWRLLARIRPGATRTAGAAGALVVLAHALDGASTAVGVDVMGFGERTPLSRLVLEFGATLPTEPYLGAGWLFVLVKLTLAAALVTLLAPSVRESAPDGWLLLTGVAAVGLGPAVHNLLLFAVASPG